MAREVLGLLLPLEYVKLSNGRRLRRCHMNTNGALKLGIVTGYTARQEPMVAKNRLIVWVDRARLSRKAGVLRLQVLVGYAASGEKCGGLKMPDPGHPIKCELVFDVTTGICNVPDELVS